MPISKLKLLTALIVLSATLPVQSQANQALCSGLFSSVSRPFKEIPGAHKIFVSADEIKGAITFSTSSLVANITEIKYSLTSQIPFEAALSPHGALGYGGPLGPLSPLGQWGSVGTKIIHPTYLISGTDWSKPAKYLTANGGPLDSNGVFGSYGANSKFGQSLNSMIPGSKSLEEGEPLMVLGTKGLLGPLHLLGALGPNGAHGYKRDKDTGAYVTKDNKTIHETLVKTENGQSSEKLVELFTETHATRLSKSGKLEDRFAIDLKIQADNYKDFNYHAKSNEWVIFSTIPSGFGDHFSIEILDIQGHVLSKSNSSQLINMSVFKFAQDAEVIIRVKNEGPSPYYNAYIEAMNSYYSSLAAMNPFFNFKDLMPPNVLTRTSECRVLVGTAPVDESVEITPGPHWSQFF